ncbi:MAG: HepT-like ribonuclease domain-containing protein [Candidatus Bathyarchaeia archaeon]
MKDRKTVYAVLRALEIIGEAVKNVPRDLWKRHPEVPRKEMAGMRDKLIHEYVGVDLKKVGEPLRKYPKIETIIRKNH